VIEGLKGFGEGIENGSLAFFNALTGGAYDVFSYSYMNNDYAKRQEKMQKLAESANLGREYKLANYAIDTGGKVEFIKNGACPTYVKNGNSVHIIKSLSLPAGILKDINLTTYDKDIENQDIFVMCSDGILDANVEYKNKELWVKYLLEDIETTSVQKIADLILNEAVDNSYGVTKDDMSLIVCKLILNKN